MGTTQRASAERIRDAITQEQDGATSPLLDQIITEMNTLAQRTTRVSPVRLRTFEDLERFAAIASRSVMVPKDYQGKPENCILAVQMGSELGLAPMQSLQNIAVINGRPAVWGDALPGLVRASGTCAYIKEWHDGSGEGLTYWCECKRKDDPNSVKKGFSVTDAKTAKLWGKKGYNGQDTPWVTHPTRMLQMRARGFALRDGFPDVLKGLTTAEEAQDIALEHMGISLPELSYAEPVNGSRDALNDTIPLSGAVPTFDDETPADRWPTLFNEPNGNKWLANLLAALAAAASADEVRELEGLTPVTSALSGAPTKVKSDISAGFSQAFGRFAPGPRVDNAPENEAKDAA